MRRFLFRGKRVDNGEWVYGNLIQMSKDSSQCFIFPFYNYASSLSCSQIVAMDMVEVDPETVGQYTGLKDKNGTKIFEGDIVAFEDSDGGYEYKDLAVNTGVVEYGELRFYFTNRVAVEMDDFYIKDGRCDDIEVIGNIHDKAGDERWKI